MKKYLLYNKRSYITARALATKLGLLYHRNPNAIKRRGGIVMIRYGKSEGDFRNDTKFNSPNVIKICADSLRFSKWAVGQDILSPEYRRFNLGRIPNYPFLLRKRWHRAGRDIIVINNENDLDRAVRNYGRDYLNGRFWVPIFHTQYEIRLHIVDGNVIRIFVKQPTEDVNPDDFIRTAPRGWHYSLRTNLDKKYDKAQELATAVAKTLNLGFGGLDMAWCPDEKQYIIWEINTAPGLSENSQEAYASVLRQYV